MSLGFIFLIVMQIFVAIPSVVLEKMTLEAAIFGNFQDISELKLSLQPKSMGCHVSLLRCTSCRVTAPLIIP